VTPPPPPAKRGPGRPPRPVQIAAPGDDDNLAADIRSIIVMAVAAIRTKVENLIAGGDMTEEQVAQVAKLANECGTLLNSVRRADEGAKRITLPMIEARLRACSPDERAHVFEKFGVVEDEGRKGRNVLG
jgi:hypothetical protein